MQEKEVTIINHTGLHTRPAKELVKLANTFQSEIKISKNGKEANAKSFISVISLGAAKGAVLKFVASGEDEEMAIQSITELVETKFGEEM